MSPAVGNFVHDLVEMAKAMEQLPIAEEARRSAEAHAEELRQAVTSRESHIIDLKNELDAVNAKLRSVEAERDNASFRLLEVEDTFAEVFSHVGSALSAARKVQDTIAPPKVELEPVAPPAPVVSEALPSAPAPHEMSSIGDKEPHPPQVDDPNLPLGESAMDPTTASTPTGSIGSTSSEGPVEAERSIPRPQPYAGKNWKDIAEGQRPHDRNDWYDGGGSAEGWYDQLPSIA